MTYKHLVYSHLLIFLMFTKTAYAQNDDNMCKRKTRIITVAICSDKYANYCCPSIRFANGTISKGTSSRCVPSTKDMSCHAGFYSKNGSIEACPSGYYCPGGTRCMVPCCSGEFCPGYKLNETSLLCTHPEHPDIIPLTVDNTTKCPGSSNRAVCTKGFFCPNPSEKLPCPKGKRCLRGSSKPIRCNWFGECDFFEDPNIDNVIGLVLEGILLFTVIIVLVIKYRLRKRSILVRQEVKNFFEAKKSFKTRQKNQSMFNIPSALWSLATVDITGYRESLPNIKRAFTVHTEDYSFTLKSQRKLLRNADVTFQHSKVNVLMGPSGCGKSTLINSIMGYNKDHGDTSGTLFLNEVEIESLSKIKYYVGYVTQHDIMHDNLTVKEILTYQAQLKLPVEDSNNEYITSSVTEVINLLALNQIGDRVVGSLDDNLISGGQRRRLSIGMELITNPSILILDEPTSGLDSATSLIIMQLLRNLSHQININVICVIHQPRVELFLMFDNLTLLTNNGRVAYNGKASLIQDYFTELGFQFPENANPADIIIDILSGFIVSNQFEVRHLYKVWKRKHAARELSISVEDLLDGSGRNGGGKLDTLLRVSKRNRHQLDMKRIKSRGYFDQWLVMLHREVVSSIRYFPLLFAEVVIAFVLGLGMAFLFRKIDLGYETTKVNLEVVTIGLLVSVGSLRVFGRDRLIFLREARSGVHTVSYFFAKTIVHLPSLFFFIPVAYVGIYWTAGDFKADFAIIFLLFTLAAYAASGFSYLVSVICQPNLANLITIGFTLVSAMFAGCTLTICDLDALVVAGPILYTTSYARWFVQAQLITEWNLYDEPYHLYFQKRFWENKYTEHGERKALWVLVLLGSLFRFATLLVLFYQKSNVSMLHEIRMCFRKGRMRNKTPESRVAIRDFSLHLKETESLV